MCDHDPRWKTSQGGSRGGLGSSYGESAQTVGATASSGVRLKVRMAPETSTNLFDDPHKAARSGVIAGVCSAEDGQAQPVRAAPAGGSRWRCLASDRRYVMLPAPLEVRATSVFLRGGRSR